MKFSCRSHRSTARKLSWESCRSVLLAAGLLTVLLTGSASFSPVSQKRIIGPVTRVEAVDGFQVLARVDTGATTCSLHADEWIINDASSDMAQNVGKTIRFRTVNRYGQVEWIERTIAECAMVKTSDCEEARYKVPMTLSCQGISKNVLVTLNDRSHMTYAMLLGRNFLENDFLVDVAHEAEAAP